MFLPTELLQLLYEEEKLKPIDIQNMIILLLFLLIYYLYLCKIEVLVVKTLAQFK